MERLNVRTFWLGGVVVGLLLSSHAGAAVSSPGGINLNTFDGADRFYNAGYTGTRAVVANVEGQFAWNGHETLTKISQYVRDPSAVSTFGDHPTQVSFTIAGNKSGATASQKGIAYGASLWSGAIATSVSGGSFSISNASVTVPYKTFMNDGLVIGGQTRKADVINSSWGDSGDPLANSYHAKMIDAFAYANGTIVVAASGNTGYGGNKVGSPASGYNSISVAALTSDTSSPIYGSAASFSSGGANQFYNPQTNTIDNTTLRPVVDIAAPGTNIYMATGTSGLGTSYTTSQGTSFAAPQVAGGAALLVDAGYAGFNGESSIDGRVIKSVLMNSADKTPGWTNSAYIDPNFGITTGQGLDLKVGAGRMNLTKAYDQYLIGTTDAPGLASLNSVQPIGWDFGSINDQTDTQYNIATQLVGGSTFTATLSWFANRTYSSLGVANDIELADLALYVYQILDEDTGQFVALSQTKYDTSEHLTFTIPTTGYYGIGVSWVGEHYDLAFDSSNTQLFGLAWSGVGVPEPGTISLIGLAGLVGLARRRRK